MLQTTTSKQFSGTSTVENAGTTGTIENVVVANMYATINENGNININKTIMDQKAYVEHKEEVEKDMRDFVKYMKKLEIKKNINGKIYQ